jgi:hypothetical protein
MFKNWRQFAGDRQGSRGGVDHGEFIEFNRLSVDCRSAGVPYYMPLNWVPLPLIDRWENAR